MASDSSEVKVYNVIYSGENIREAARLEQYLDESGRSADEYIRSLIRSDLAERGVVLPEEGASAVSAPYDALTRFIPVLDSMDRYSEWALSERSDNSPNMTQISYLRYAEPVQEFQDEVRAFMKEHPSLLPDGFREKLTANGIAWVPDAMRDADVRNADAESVMALIIGAIRAEDFCEGTLDEFLREGSIVRWLRRLEEIGSAPRRAS